MRLNYNTVKPILKMALNEDLNSGDITTNSCISKSAKTKATITAKEDGIICGLDLIKFIFKLIKSNVSIQLFYQDGSTIKKGKTIAILKGKTRDILSCERIILNFLQQLSGVATTANIYANKIKTSKTKILDTRKTIPGLRYLQKYAVACGGAKNHRKGLYDMVLIKDNHIKAAGSISKAVNLARTLNHPIVKIEVETSTIKQVKEALKTDCNWIMLDNMTIKEMKESIKLVNNKKTIEISGGITLKNLALVGNIGADYISVGAITHSFNALDISMNVEI